MISISMLRVCGGCISELLQINLNSCNEKGEFPNDWIKANVFPGNKKGDKQVSRNQRRASNM